MKKQSLNIEAEIRIQRALEVAGVVQLNSTLAVELARLVPLAITQAKAKKPDTRLLRLIVRYAGTVSRRMPGLNLPTSTPPELKE